MENSKGIQKESEKRIKNFKEQLEIFRYINHEVKTPLSALSGQIKIIQINPKKDLIKLLPNLSKQVSLLLDVQKTFYQTPEEIKKDTKILDINEILKNSSIPYENLLGNREINIYYKKKNPEKIHEALTAFLTQTIIGDSVKRTPFGTSINLAVNEKEKFYEIIFENFFTDEIISPEIGFNQGLGKKIINYCITKTDYIHENDKNSENPKIDPENFSKKYTLGKIKNHLEPESPKIKGFYSSKVLIPKIKKDLTRLL